MNAIPPSETPLSPRPSSCVSPRQRITALAVAAAVVCSGAASCTKTQVALSGAAIAAVIVGATVGVTLAVQHSHHTLEGCIFTGPDGLKLRLSDARTYTLKGEIANVKPGDRLKVHGSRVKRDKRGSAGDQVFLVEKVKKDYGPCPANLTASPTR